MKPRRKAAIRRLEFEALDAARSMESPYIKPKVTNPRALAILKLAGEYYRGERKPTPQVRAIAAAILKNANRLNSRS
jgi:hypothetical protein